ncbi:unnamed protein product [Sphagnum balticum]
MLHCIEEICRAEIESHNTFSARYRIRHWSEFSPRLRHLFRQQPRYEYLGRGMDIVGTKQNTTVTEGPG